MSRTANGFSNLQRGDPEPYRTVDVSYPDARKFLNPKAGMGSGANRSPYATSPTMEAAIREHKTASTLGG